MACQITFDQEPVVAGTVDGQLAVWVGTPAAGAGES